MNGCRFFDGPLRIFVPSDNTDNEHLVELDAFGGFGRCSCQHFEFRMLPLLEPQSPGAPKPPGAWHQCRHIKAAREFFTNAMIARLAQTKP